MQSPIPSIDVDYETGYGNVAPTPIQQQQPLNHDAMDGSKQAVLALATLSVFLAGLDATLISLARDLFNTTFSTPPTPP
ncbi:hypothetical protein C8J57DRAFT_1517449 [Mycena rebaudengoi]|nr:hypothetical protein C8J57DRAFT_1517449 [Mycena rebaudengoi]